MLRPADRSWDRTRGLKTFGLETEIETSVVSLGTSHLKGPTEAAWCGVRGANLRDKLERTPRARAGRAGE